jgi:hypothetical protein
MESAGEYLSEATGTTKGQILGACLVPDALNLIYSAGTFANARGVSIERGQDIGKEANEETRMPRLLEHLVRTPFLLPASGGVRK